MPTRSFQGFRPSPRFDDFPWDRALISEGADADGPFTLIETVFLDPIDADAAHPAARSFTTTNAVLEEGFYEILFEDSVGNDDEPVVVEYPGSGYPSPAELVSDSSLDELTALPYEDVEPLWLSAKLAVEQYTGQTFDFEENVIVRLDGTGDRRIFLPRRLETLTALTAAGSSLGASDVELGPNHDRLTVLSTAGIGNYYQRALSAAWEEGSLCFTTGHGTVTITGDWGWEEFPQAVRDAMRFDMEDSALADANALSATVKAVRKMGMNAIGQGGLRAQLVTPPTVSPRVAALLAPYAWHGHGGSLA